MSSNSYLLANRVGEASNPGPLDEVKRIPSLIRCAVCNPHAILSNKQEILQLQSQVVFVSETSATKVAQAEFTNNIKHDGYSVYWSAAVDPKVQTVDGRPSFRGEPIGTAILTSLRNRFSRVSIPEDLHATCRVNTSVVFFGGMEVLLVCVYGFAKKCLEGRRLNDILLARIFNIVNDCRMPFIVGGDFNSPPTSLPSFKAFAEMGAVEIFTYYCHVTGLELPKTCKNATSNDTMILHPRLVPFIKKMEVRQDLKIDVHSPMIVHFDLAKVVEPQMIWKIPHSWHSLVDSPQILEQSYELCRNKLHFDQIVQESEKDDDELLHVWSKLVENAVDRTIQIQHLNQPEKFPTKGLPESYRGRCV